MKVTESIVKEIIWADIVIWLLFLEEIPDEDFAKMYAHCSGERRKKIERIKPGLKKRQSIGAGYLLYLLRKKYSIETEPIILSGGKPVFSDNESVQFSISHCGEAVVLAFGKRPLGVDTEYVRQANLKLAERFFAREEYQSLLLLEDEEQADAFYRIWTGKEAVVKAAGCGLSTPLNVFSVLGETVEMSGNKYELHRQKFILGENSLWISAAQLVKDFL
ncbi:4'-phosphopantetheinyl transferase superfamily protein [Lachnospiraceae bacterium 38-10]